MISGVLEKIVNSKRDELSRLQDEVLRHPDHPLNEIMKRAEKPVTRFKEALRLEHGIAVIAEIKRRSPSVGMISSIENTEDWVVEYLRGNASAISVLTDPVGFGGCLSDLSSVTSSLKAKKSSVPVLRKDFILHPLQIAETVLSGGQAVLLIASVLNEEQLGLMLREAGRMGLEALVEVHTREELELSLNAGASVVGVNQRDLKTFQMVPKVFNELRPFIPPHIVAVAESGINRQEQAATLKSIGYDAILVGEGLIRSANPAELIRSFQKASQ